MRKFIVVALLPLLFISASVAAHAAQETGWYVNMKYGFSVMYQKNLFHPQGEAADGSGQHFRGMDGKAVVSAYGHDANENYNLTSVYNETLLNLDKEGWKIAHKSIKGDTFILRGARDTVIFYKKVVYKQKNRQFVNFEAVYDASRGKF